MTGSVAANLHEGSRSEYLAQYLFASFGTVVPVPHQEDTGLDLYCTLTERLGARAFPRAYYSVQVKSTMAPWVLEGFDSVKWLIEHPLPLFLCVVDKKALQLRLYHTAPRFYAWALPPLPERLELVPATDEHGRCTQWSSGNTFSLSAPILDAAVSDLLDDEFQRRAIEVIRFWTDVDAQNLTRIRSDLHTFRMPDEYTTNTTDHRAWVEQGVTDDPDPTRAIEHAKLCLAYLMSQLRRRGDFGGAARCVMLLRHFSPRYVRGEPIDHELLTVLNATAPVSRRNDLFRGVDALNEVVDKAVRRCARRTQPQRVRKTQVRRAKNDSSKQSNDRTGRRRP